MNVVCVISPAWVEAFLLHGGLPWDQVYVMAALDQPPVPLRTWLAMTGRSPVELAP